MAVKSSSREAYDDLILSGKKDSQQAKVLDLLLEIWPNGATRKELASMSGLELASVCGRVNELMKLECIEEPGKKTCSVTGRNVFYVKAVMTDNDLQGDLF